MGLRLLFFASAILGMLFLAGCVQDSPPKQCLSVAQDKFANCVYNAAVLEQNPFYCYSLSDLEKRATCMKDATDPNVQKALQRAGQGQRDAVFTEPSPKNETPPAPQNESGQQDPLSAVRPCEALPAVQKDSCVASAALNSSIISFCDLVNASPSRDACIGQVARKTKDLESCKTLASEEGRSLCRLYAQAGTQ